MYVLVKLWLYFFIFESIINILKDCHFMGIFAVGVSCTIILNDGKTLDDSYIDNEAVLKEPQ